MVLHYIWQRHCHICEALHAVNMYVHECGCLQVLGLGEKWEGGDVRHRAGGGQKINLFRKELLRHKDDANKIIMFTDRYACHPICCVSFQLQSVVQLIYWLHYVCVCLQL